MFVKDTTSSQKTYFQPLTTKGKMMVVASIIALITGTVIAALGIKGYFGPSFSDGYTLATQIGGWVSAAGATGLLILGLLNHLDRPKPPLRS